MSEPRFRVGDRVIADPQSDCRKLACMRGCKGEVVGVSGHLSRELDCNVLFSDGTLLWVHLRHLRAAEVVVTEDDGEPD